MPSRSPRALPGLAFALVCAVPALAGPLTPPAGTPAPTYKTLHQVEPSTPIETLPIDGPTQSILITQPGAYHLTGNLQIPAGVTNGIRVEAVDVLIDLRGFSILGNGTTANAVSTADGIARVTVRNGSIIDLGGGRAFNGPTSDACAFENLHIINVGPVGGIAIRARHGLRVERVTFSNSGRIWADDNAIIRGCTFLGSREAVLADDNAIITDCVLTGLGGSSFNNELIEVGNNALIERVAMTGSFEPAIEAGDNAIIRNSAFHNDGASPTFGATVTTGVGSLISGVSIRNWGGIGTNNGCTVEHCSIWGAPGVGISVSYGRVDSCRLAGVGATNISASASVVTNCRIDSPTASLGILAGFESILINNRIVGPATGIDMTNGSIAEGNILNANATNGILMRETSRATNNQLRGTALTVSGSNNRVQGNTLTGPAPKNLTVTGSANHIFGNFVYGGIYNVGGGNAIGAVTAGGGTITNSTGSFANFQY